MGGSKRAAVVADEGEVLATGWEADTPADDTLLRRALECMASTSEALSRAHGRVGVRRGGACIAPTGGRGILAARVMVIAPPGSTTATEVTERVRSLIPTDDALVISPFPLVGAVEAGWQPVGYPPVMLRWPAPLPEAPTDVVVEEVATPTAMLEADRVLVEGYPVPEHGPVDEVIHHLPGNDLRTWLARLHDRPVGVASAVVAHGMVCVENVAVLPSARGRGIGLAVTSAACGAAPDLPATLLASDDGRPIYDRLGFEALARVACWYLPGSG